MKAKLIIKLDIDIELPDGQNTLNYDVGSIFEPLEGHPDVGAVGFVIEKFEEVI
jgi:hypothetical protein